MIKLSVNLIMDEERGVLVNPEGLKEIAFACQKVLLELGTLARLIEVFRITWVNHGKGFGPEISIYFHDPMGEKCSHTTDYRFMGNRSINPTADDISKNILSDLPRLMEERIKISRTKLSKVQKSFKELENPNQSRLTVLNVLRMA